MCKNLIVFLPNWIGDVVMATPALRAMRNRFPANETNIIGVMKPYVSRVLDGTPWIDQIVCHDRNARNSLRNAWDLVRRLRALQPEIAVYMTNSMRPAAIGWLSGCTRRVGFDRNGRGLLLTKRLSWPRDGWRWRPKSAVDMYLELVYALGCPIVEQPRLELAVTASERELAVRIWRRLGLDQLSRVVLLNLGSANGTARHWPSEYYVQLARRMAQDPETGVLIICGPAQEEDARHIEITADHPRVKSMAGQDLSLGASKACISLASLMVSSDSGPRHIAAAFGVPTITISGPIDPRFGNNYHPDSVVLCENLPCRPCGRHVCRVEGHPCMRDLTPERVYQECVRLLDDRKTQHAA